MAPRRFYRAISLGAGRVAGCVFHPKGVFGGGGGDDHLRLLSGNRPLRHTVRRVLLAKLGVVFFRCRSLFYLGVSLVFSISHDWW